MYKIKKYCNCMFTYSIVWTVAGAVNASLFKPEFDLVFSCAFYSGNNCVVGFIIHEFFHHAFLIIFLTSVEYFKITEVPHIFFSNSRQAFYN